MEEFKILLAEDDPNLGKILKAFLEAKGFVVDLFINGEEALMGFHKKNDYQILVLDVMMPIMDGFTLASNVRKSGSKVPILFLTAKSLEEDKLKGFEIGGDDYITKPFNMELLLARLNAILRRSGAGAKDNDGIAEYKIGKFTYNYEHQKLSADGLDQKLTSKEAELMKMLCDHENEVLDRRIALNKIWKDDSYFNARSMDVYITKLRKYLKSDETIQIINVHGIGFKLLTR
ncbi:MAG: response regulator transcription factor [Bacteroidales bacterium]|nr:response regulator transcription factor [Bacteroidales bacterium]